MWWMRWLLEDTFPRLKRSKGPQVFTLNIGCHPQRTRGFHCFRAIEAECCVCAQRGRRIQEEHVWRYVPSQIHLHSLECPTRGDYFTTVQEFVQDLRGIIEMEIYDEYMLAAEEDKLAAKALGTGD